MFEVVEKWGTRDSEKSRVVAEFPTKDEANTEAKIRFEKQVHPWSAFVVRDVTPTAELALGGGET